MQRIGRGRFHPKLPQVPHEHIAAYFRWTMPRIERREVIQPEQGPYPKGLLEAWKAFLRKEMPGLLSSDDALVSLAKSTVHQALEEGDRPYRESQDILMGHYGLARVEQTGWVADEASRPSACVGRGHGGRINMEGDLFGLIEKTGRPTLGVVAISRNEEQDLPGFFKHLVPWVDEIIIVDDASADRTADIIKNAGPKVNVIEHPMDKELGFAGQRNLGIEASTADWLLHMDVDERVTPELAEEILKSIWDTTKNAYRYRRLNYFLHYPMRGGGWQYWNFPQLARRGKHYFRVRSMKSVS